ncbi:hypothetical protein FRB97_009767 [Tulasnella sp. 331]|nr:hypothetical protein FRB97_009767 [Tulasnella sp. 331]KAG8872574.1 hypothetical protein FRB98_009533 [Tulasnella sp. 332]
MPFTPQEIAYVDIYPPVAIARVGDSQKWYMGPEIPGVDPMPKAGFKDQDHKIKKVAARFRVYAFKSDGTVLGEIDGKGEYEIQWTVHVANKKSAWVRFRGQYKEESWELRNPSVQGWPDESDKKYEWTNHRTKLIIDSGERKIKGLDRRAVPLTGQFYGSFDTPTSVHLGEILTDDHGRLIVLAGDGMSYSLLAPSAAPEDQPYQEGLFDNDNWVDSMFDGNVQVLVSNRNSPDLVIPVKNRATIISAPPRFAHGFHCPTTLLELMEDVYERPKRALGTEYNVGKVYYYRHIEPLFERMYLMSWTNFRANEGHGPRKAALWLDNEALYNPKTENKTVRENIFKRIRAPVKKNNPDNLALRESQSYMYWMPRLGGNSSDMPEDSEEFEKKNSANRWASLTELQYDRLYKWSLGQFERDEKIVPPGKFEDIDLLKQPEALMTAALEWSVGAPLYPGIECFWVAEFDDHYKLSDRFRFSDTVTPGDLGKGLALPWQADFFMCNTHWWPSVRPDNIVTEADFLRAEADFVNEPHNLALNLTKRIRWDDGLDIRPETGIENWGNSDLTRKWHKMGFVARQQYGPKKEGRLAIYIEKERHPSFPHSQNTTVRGTKGLSMGDHSMRHRN